MKEFVGLRAKTLCYLLNDDSEEKKQKALRSVLLKENLNLKIIKTC